MSKTLPLSRLLWTKPDTPTYIVYTKPMPGPAYSDMLSAADDVLQALEDIGETWCCLVGGLAVRLWGVQEHVVKASRILV